MGHSSSAPRPQSDPPGWDEAIAALAKHQHGVVSTAQLRAIGLSSRAVHHRASRGRLHRVHRGVYSVGHQVLGPDGSRMAAVLACGPGAVLSHRSAADLHGVRRNGRARHEVSVPGRTRRRAAGIDAHRPRRLRPEDVTTIRGIPVTTLARTLLDCASVLHRPALARCLHEAEILRILDIAAIDRQLVGARGKCGASTLAALIADYALQPAHEGLETTFAAIMPPDLPPHEFNVYVGPYEVDVLFPAQRVIVELDDVRTHRTTRAFQRDPNATPRLPRSATSSSASPTSA